MAGREKGRGGCWKKGRLGLPRASTAWDRQMGRSLRVLKTNCPLAFFQPNHQWQWQDKTASLSSPPLAFK